MITTHSIKEYIEKNNVRKMVRWKIHDGKWFFELFPGFWQHEQSFDRFFPQYEYNNYFLIPNMFYHFYLKIFFKFISRYHISLGITTSITASTPNT